MFDRIEVVSSTTYQFKYIYLDITIPLYTLYPEYIYIQISLFPYIHCILSIYIYLNISIHLYPLYAKYLYIQISLFPYIHCILSIALTGSTYTNVSLALERFLCFNINMIHTVNVLNIYNIFLGTIVNQSRHLMIPLRSFKFSYIFIYPSPWNVQVDPYCTVPVNGVGTFVYCTKFFQFSV